MENLNSFIITLTTVIVFISAVELIFPDNSFKKYQSFVLGLIVLAVILTPILKFLTSSENIGEQVKMALEETESEADGKESYKGEKNGEYVLYSLKSNCEKFLREKYEDKDFKVEIDGKIDFNSYETNINSVTVISRNKGSFEPIIVNPNEEIEIKETEFNNEIKKSLSDELKISEDLIKVIEK